MTDKERDELLISIAKQIVKINQKVGDLEPKIIERFEAMEIKMSAIEKEMNERFEAMEIKMSAIEKEMNDKFDVQRRNMAKMEYTFSDKISALFDVREINIDKFNEHNKEIESIHQILDNFNQRISKLEMLA